MDMQNVAKLNIPEGDVRTIHDKDGNLIWGKVSYGVKYKGDTAQNGTPTPSAPVAVQTVTGENVVKISDGQGNEQSYEVNLGKNLFDKSTATDGYRIDSAGAPYADDGYFLSDYIEVIPAATYTYSRAYSGSTRSAYAFYDGSKTFISRTYPVIGTSVLSGNITAPANARYIRFADTNNVLDNAQLELGSTATSYAPYFTPIELCKIGDYQDYIYKTGGKWYVHKEVSHTLYTGNVLGIAANNNSGENIASATGAFFVWVGYVGLMSENLGTLNDGAISGNADANAMTSGTFATRSGTPDRLYFRNTAYIGKTGNEMKAILAGNSGGASIWYALATPTDTEITNEALIAQLEAVGQWLNRYGYNATVSGNLPIIIDRTAL